MSWQLTKFLRFSLKRFQTESKRDKYFVSMSLIFHNFYFYYIWLFLQKKKTFWKWTFSNHHSLSSFWISSVKFGCKCWMFFSQSPFIRKSFRKMIYAVCHKAFNKIDFSVWSAGDENFLIILRCYWSLWEFKECVWLFSLFFWPNALYFLTPKFVLKY